MQYLELFSLDFHDLMVKFLKNLDFMLNTQFLYQQNAYFILYDLTTQNFNITFCKDYKGQ